MARAIAFLDILGFKQMLQERPLAELAKDYEGAVQQAASLNQKHQTDRSAPTYLPNHKPGVNRPGFRGGSTL